MSELRFEDVTVRYGAQHDRRRRREPDGARRRGPRPGRESGSGKSTLARAAVGLAPIDERPHPARRRAGAARAAGAARCRWSSRTRTRRSTRA